MRTALVWLVGVGVLVAGCGGAPPNGTVDGKVAFADGTPAPGVALALTGETVLAATTDASGHYGFTKVPKGDYVLSADVSGTLERHAQVVVIVGKAGVTVPTLTFTAVGTVSGTVVDSTGSPAEGAEVRVLGTDRAASTDAAGTFTVTRVRTGAEKLMASFGTGADRVTGTAKVTVKRGASATAKLTLAAPPPPPPAPTPGTVTGTVTYPLLADASTITIAAVGSTATTHPNPDGTFSLDLPPGTWRIEATAAEYPKQMLGRVRVRSGGTVAVPPKVLSMYRPLPLLAGGGTWSTMVPPMARYLPTGGRFLAEYQGPSGTRLYAIDADTLALHPMAVVGPGGGPGAGTLKAVLGPKGQQVAAATDGTIAVMSVDGGPTVTVQENVGTILTMTFSVDGKSLMVVGPDGLDRVDVATGKMTRVGTSGVLQVGVDQFLVETANASGAETWALVTDAGVLPKVLDGVSQILDSGPVGPMGTQPIAVVARNDCGASGTACPLVDLAPGATAAVPVTLPDGSPYTASGDNIHDIEGPWAILEATTPGTPGTYLLDTRTGKTFKVPFTSPRLQASPDGSEVAVIDPGRAAMYVGVASAPFAGTEVHGAGLVGTFVTNDTFVAFDNSSPTARRLVFTGGAAPTVDTDYKLGSGRAGGGLAVWTRPSTGNRAARVGAAAAIDLPIPGSAPMTWSPTGFDPATGAPVAAGAVTDPQTGTTYVIDGRSGTAKVTTYSGIGIEFGLPGGFGGSGAGSSAVDLPLGGTPVPIDKPGMPFPGGGAYLAPGQSVILAPAAGPSSATEVGVFPGLLPFFT